MSADLFAVFGDAADSAAPKQQTQQSQQSQQLGTEQGRQTQHSQWPPLQQPTFSSFQSLPPITQPQPWLTSSTGGFGGLQNQTSSFSTSHNPPAAQAQGNDDDDDGWGDFEVAPSNGPPQQPSTASNASTLSRAPVVRMPTAEIVTNKFLDLDLGPSPQGLPQQQQQQTSKERGASVESLRKQVHNPDPNVLFDADFEAENDLDEDDDFGEFETDTPVAMNPPAAPPKSALDLLSLDSDFTPAPTPTQTQPSGLGLSNADLPANSKAYPEAPRPPFGSVTAQKPELPKPHPVQPLEATKTAPGIAQTPVRPQPETKTDSFGDDWAAFDDFSDTKPVETASTVNKAKAAKPTSKSTSKKPSTTTAPEWEWQDWSTTDDQPTTKNPPPSAKPPPSLEPSLPPSPDNDNENDTNPGPPPTNIPPPAILLSLFPTLLDLASTTLLKPLLTLPASSPAYQRVLAAPATLTFLRGYLALATVAARLIAGRRQRWLRDKFLAQGMSIAAVPSSGGGQRGMKLASVDKAHAAHDEREAAEVVGVWKKQVGRLRTVVAGVNAANTNTTTTSSSGPNLRVPDVAVGLAVSTAKNVPTAPKACVVCGLKRDERVAKVDFDVEDSFGEWWVEFWGHRACRNFWLRHERELRQR
ncbi:hypothetical protein B0J18DRAFT_429698 [Chaetomium sp. MPI-SDFR-AT-0129]|nr:hypothetical protein B0J18DRAFT_429698 [Chaetomium sp. MPI-SDFR-AT-0129]